MCAYVWTDIYDGFSHWFQHECPTTKLIQVFISDMTFGSRQWFADKDTNDGRVFRDKVDGTVDDTFALGCFYQVLKTASLKVSHWCHWWKEGLLFHLAYGRSENCMKLAAKSESNKWMKSTKNALMQIYHDLHY